MNVIVEITSNPKRLSDVSDHLDTLARACVWPNIFYEEWFIQAALLLDDTEIEHLLVWSGGGETKKLIGYMPLEPRKKVGVFRPRTVENWKHKYCFLAQPLILSGYENVFWSSFLSKIDESPQLGTTMRLKSMCGFGASFDALLTELNAGGYWFNIYRTAKRPVLYHHGEAETYFKNNISNKRRKEYLRRDRRISELEDTAYEHLSSSQELNGWIEQFLKLESKGWKGEAGTALANNDVDANFFRSITKRAFNDNRLYMIRLRHKSDPVAMLITYTAPPRGAFGFKVAYDEDFKKYAPGVLLELEFIRRALDDQETGVQWTDSCTSEDAQMIQELWKDTIDLVSIKISPKRPLSRIFSIYDHAFTKLFSKLKS